MALALRSREAMNSFDFLWFAMRKTNKFCSFLCAMQMRFFFVEVPVDICMENREISQQHWTFSAQWKLMEGDSRYAPLSTHDS